MRTLNSGSVLCTTCDGVVVLTLHRPDARNAIDPATRALIAELLAEADTEPVGCVVLTGTDPAFCAGLDVRALADSLNDGPPPGPNPGEAIRAARVPTIAAVNGACVTGGLEIALSCDFVIASDRSFFADTHARLGLAPAGGMWGMTALLPEAVGRRRAKEMSLTGRRVAALEAQAIGLVNSVVEHDQLLTNALGLAKAICANAPSVSAAWLAAYDDTAGLPVSDALAHEGRLPRQP
jgi:enoyl-CoA hydratase